MSGANVYVDGETDFLKGNDADGVYAWMDNYCRAHPLDSLPVAAAPLIRELFDRTKSK